MLLYFCVSICFINIHCVVLSGVGVTVLSYAGRLQLGLMADRALIACQQDAQLILDGLAAAIQQMDQISSPP